MARAARQLGDLISIGPAMLRDFELLGIRSVAQLARQNPRKLYEKLGPVAGQHQDICVPVVFCAAVAQARNPRLDAEKCHWWWWSKQRRLRGNEVRIPNGGAAEGETTRKNEEKR